MKTNSTTLADLIKAAKCRKGKAHALTCPCDYILDITFKGNPARGLITDH